MLSLTGIDQEKRDYFKKRTDYHVGLVRKYIDEICDSGYFTFTDDLKARKEDHDQSKYHQPEIAPYVYITWKYNPDEGKSYTLSDEMNEQLRNATYHHVKTNRHHPEYHDPITTIDSINQKDRDQVPSEIVDGTAMTDVDIAEMCADWMAVSHERGTNPIEWADKNINKRWKFTDHQIELIYAILNLYQES